MSKCEAMSKGETGKADRGQDLDLTCNKNGRHVVHEDNRVGAKFVKLGPAGDVVWPSS